MQGGEIEDRSLIFTSDSIVLKYISKYAITNILHGGNGYTIFIEKTDDPSFFSRVSNAITPQFAKKGFYNAETQSVDKSLLIKMCVLAKDANIRPSYNPNKVFGVNLLSESEFTAELAIQKEVYEKTKPRLCPTLINLKPENTIISFTSRNKFMDKLLPKIRAYYSKDTESPHKLTQFDQILRYFQNSGIHIGLCAMELAKNYDTAWNINKRNNAELSILRRYDPNYLQKYNTLTTRKQTIVNTCRCAILELTKQTRYHHNDFHMANILLKLDKPHFDTYGHEFYIPLVIDYGRAFKLDDAQYNTFNDLYITQKYMQALSFLCQNSNDAYRDVLTDMTNSDMYGYICGNYTIPFRRSAKGNLEVIADEFDKKYGTDQDFIYNVKSSIESYNEKQKPIHNTNLEIHYEKNKDRYESRGIDKGKFLHQNKYIPVKDIYEFFPNMASEWLYAETEEDDIDKHIQFIMDAAKSEVAPEQIDIYTDDTHTTDTASESPKSNEYNPSLVFDAPPRNKTSSWTPNFAKSIMPQKFPSLNLEILPHRGMTAKSSSSKYRGGRNFYTKRRRQGKRKQSLQKKMKNSKNTTRRCRK